MCFGIREVTAKLGNVDSKISLDSRLWRVSVPVALVHHALVLVALNAVIL